MEGNRLTPSRRAPRPGGRTPRAALAALAGVLALAASGPGASAAPAGTITEYPVKAGTAPVDLVLSATGNAVQFAEPRTGTLGTVGEKGRYSRNALPLVHGRPTAVAVGADHGLWITLPAAATVERWAAGKVRRFALPPGSAPGGITAGSAALWLCATGTNRIARLSLTGGLHEYRVPTAHAGLARITVGPDGRVWFTEHAADRVGRLDPATGRVAELRLPAGATPSGITTGPDGNVWVTETGLGQVAVVDPATFEVAATFPAGVRPVGITSGVDDAVWVADNGGNAILRIAPDGTLTSYPVPTPRAGLNGIALGPRGDIWFTESRANRIGRVAVGDPHTQYTTVRAVVTEPAPPRLKVGSTMQWTFTGPGVQSVTDASGLGLFDSGRVSFVTTFTHVFPAAGDYPFRSSRSSLGGVVKVLPIVQAQGATAPTAITVTWATGPPDPGFAYDVQLRLPGETAFHGWQTGTTQASAQLNAPNPGTYAFQAKLVSLSQPAAGPGWSSSASARIG